MGNESLAEIEVDLAAMQEAHRHVHAALHILQDHLPQNIMPLAAVSMNLITSEATLRVLISSLIPEGSTN